MNSVRIRGIRTLCTKSRKMQVPKASLVGSVVTSVTVKGAPSHSTANVKVLYPASEKVIGVTRAPKEGPTWPVVLFLPGVSIESNRYQWLGEELVLGADVVFVSYDHFDFFGGFSVLTPSFSGESTQLPADAIVSAVLEKLMNLNSASVLAGHLDLERVILGGHSFGGSLALLGANRDLLPSARGVFTYGAHSANGPIGGFPPGTIESVSGTVPLMLMAGTQDGVIATSGPRFGTEWKTATEPVQRTFEEALDPSRTACYVELDGANHMAIVNPVDRTIPSASQDFRAKFPKEDVAQILTECATAFVRKSMENDAPTAQDFKSVLPVKSPLVSKIMYKP